MNQMLWSSWIKYSDKIPFVSRFGEEKRKSENFYVNYGFNDKKQK